MSFVAERLIKVRFLFLLFVLSACRNAAIAADDVVINNFEADTYGNWVVKGEAFEPGPVRGAVDGQMPVSGVLGKGVANRFSKGDEAVGTMTSPEFVTTHNHIAFLIGGGKIPDALGIELLADGQRVRSEKGTRVRGHEMGVVGCQRTDRPQSEAADLRQSDWKMGTYSCRSNHPDRHIAAHHCRGSAHFVSKIQRLLS